MRKFKYFNDPLDASSSSSIDEQQKEPKRSQSLDRSLMLKKKMTGDKPPTTTPTTDEKMAEELTTQFIKILKERNALKAQIDAKNTDLLNISQDLVSMTM